MAYSIASAFDINTDGKIDGTSLGGNSSRTNYLEGYADEIDLGSLGWNSSRANEINDQGVVSGESTLAGYLEPHARRQSD